jgi:uncharacterized protein (UPF0332 family)
VTVRAHHSRWQHNEATAAQYRARRDDWWVVRTFYAALHLAQAYFVTKGLNPQDHFERSQALQTCQADLGPRAARDYRFLSAISQNVRYQPVYALTPTTETEVEEAYACVVRALKPKVEFWLSKNP